MHREPVCVLLLLALGALLALTVGRWHQLYGDTKVDIGGESPLTC
jgi:hypothetical protein